jgi:hypothetical protein
VKIGSVEAKVLISLSNSARGLHVFTIYKRLKFPLSDVIRSTLRLKELGFVFLTNDEHATLTDEGKERAFKVASEVSTKSAKPWRDVPEKYRKYQDNSDLDFFIPRMTLLGKNFF